MGNINDFFGAKGLKLANAGFYTIPSLAAPVLVAKGSAAHAYGNWVQMISSVVADGYIYGFCIETGSTPLTGYLQFQFGVGASGSEVGVGEWRSGQPQLIDSAATYAAPNLNPLIVFPQPIPVASASRIAARIAGTNTGANNYGISLIMVDKANLVSM